MIWHGIVSRARCPEHPELLTDQKSPQIGQIPRSFQCSNVQCQVSKYAGCSPSPIKMLRKNNPGPNHLHMMPKMLHKNSNLRSSKLHYLPREVIPLAESLHGRLLSPSFYFPFFLVRVGPHAVPCPPTSPSTNPHVPSYSSSCNQ